MKKFIAIFLFFALSLCSSGFYIAWYLSLHAVRQSQKEIIARFGFHKDKIIEFVFSRNDMAQNKQLRFENSNEFEFRNQMYDVVNQEVEGDSIHILCISDTEEDHLRDIAVSQLFRTGKNDTGRQLLILNFRLDPFTHVPKTNLDFHLSGKASQLYRDDHQDILPSPYQNISSPPPWHFA